MELLNRRTFIKSSSIAGMGLFLPPINLRLDNSSDRNELESGLRFRQVHLDYHTSEHIEDVARDFDPDEFARTLKNAHVNSVTAFGRCHHGYIYHDTKFTERRHPHLKRNLLKEQIDACHKLNIKVPVYVTVQWDFYTATLHPEWLMRDENGAPIAFGHTNMFQPGFYNHLCVATPYIDFLKEYLVDLFEHVPVDGLFLDIHHVRPNANRECVEGMLRKGLNPAIESVRNEYYSSVISDYKNDLTAYIRKLDSNCTIFYNGGHVGPNIRHSISNYTHLELESLPSGGWGYVHFPLTARYARTLGKEIMGMTGKFHTSWGDFHSLKNAAALEFETSMMLAMNAKCSIGDQLHPRGKLDGATYELIGEAYRKVEQKEPWCDNAEALVDIGVLSAEEFNEMRTPEMMTGAIKLLQEGSQQFDVIDSKSDFGKYKLLVLPDTIPIDELLAKKLGAYIAKGGSVIASYRSGLKPDQKSFALEEFGVSLVGDAIYSPDFIVCEGKIAEGIPATELVMYERGLEVKVTIGSTVLARVNVPYFNREWDHFSSHKHTPSSGKSSYPGIVQRGKVIYFMHPIFSQYGKNAPLWCKKLVMNAVNILLPEPLIKHTGPSTLISSISYQAERKRHVLHILHYVPERRGLEFDVVEDIIPLYNVKLSISLLMPVKSVQLVPQRKALSYKLNGNRLEFTIPKISGHEMIEIV